VSDTFILLQLSDSHLGAEWGHVDPLRALDSAIAEIGRLPQVPTAVIFTGDLSDRGDPGDYRLIEKRLASLQAPRHYLVGNHDDRAAMRSTLGLEGRGDEPLRWARTFGPLSLVGLDTQRPGRDDGQLDAEQLRWLDHTLQALPDAPTLVATHHPPFLTGVAAADACGVSDSERTRFAEIIGRHRQVVRIICGHGHRGCIASVGTCPAVIAPSIYVQGALDFSDPEAQEPFEPAGFVVHQYASGELRSHFVSVRQ
jgi:3',5'-cyclic-AMP phosphodiesterase